MYYPSVRNVFSHIIHGNTSMGGGSDDLDEILREEARHTLDHRIKQIKDRMTKQQEYSVSICYYSVFY